MGGEGSGRKPRSFTHQETRAALQSLTRKSVEVIEQALEDGSVTTATWVVEHIVGRPRQTQHIEGQVDHVLGVSEELQKLTIEELKAGIRFMLKDASPEVQAEYRVLEPEDDGNDRERGS